MIKPTVGRVVWFWPSTMREGDDTKQPFAATVAYVHSDRMVNLSVVDHNGRQYGISSVPLRQPEDESPDGMFCEWMPYQQGQAAKTDALEAQLPKSQRP
jgi:hypothetical protein